MIPRNYGPKSVGFLSRKVDKKPKRLRKSIKPIRFQHVVVLLVLRYRPWGGKQSLYIRIHIVVLGPIWLNT